VIRNGTELELSCLLDGQDVLMHLRSALELEPLPMAPGMPLTWTGENEVCCPDADRNLMALHDASGGLVLGVFGGWNPTVESPSLLDPITFEMVRDVCEPCDTPGCVPRGALDMSENGAEPVRVYDGGTANLPSYRAFVIRVADGADGIGAPDATASVIILRNP
jgi:hypothetical protein